MRIYSTYFPPRQYLQALLAGQPVPLEPLHNLSAVVINNNPQGRPELLVRHGPKTLLWYIPTADGISDQLPGLLVHDHLCRVAPDVTVRRNVGSREGVCRLLVPESQETPRGVRVRVCRQRGEDAARVVEAPERLGISNCLINPGGRGMSNAKPRAVRLGRQEMSRIWKKPIWPLVVASGS